MARLATGLPKAISFSGCGFLGVYHIGVIKCLQSYGASLLQGLEMYGGASGGGLAAAVLCLCPDKLSICEDMVYNLASRVRSLRFGAFTPGFKLSEQVEKMVDSVLPQDAHLLASNKLYLSLTRTRSNKNVLVSSYNTRADLIQVLLKSVFS